MFSSKRMTSLGISIFFLLLVCYSVVSWYFSSLIIRPTYKPETVESIKKIQPYNGIKPKLLNFVNSNDKSFNAWYFKRHDHARCAIIFTHGWNSSRLRMTQFFDAFGDSLCDFVSYDIRAHGTHQAQYSTGGILEKYDLVQISQHLMKAYSFDENEIAWFGVSLGGSTSLQAAHLNFKPAFIVADSAFKDWDTAIFERGIEMYGPWVTLFRPGVSMVIKLRTGINHLDSNTINIDKKIASPILLIHSLADTDTAPEQSNDIYNVLDKNQSLLHLTEWGSHHADDANNKPKEYKSLINQFMERFTPHFLQNN